MNKLHVFIIVSALVAVPPVVANGSQYVLPSVDAHQIDETQISDILADLINWSQAANKYRMYFAMLPRRIDVIGNVKAAVMGAPGAADVELEPFPKLKNLVIRARYAPGIATNANAFKGGVPDTDYDPSNAIFVRLDGFGNLVPVYVAEVFEAAFINGLVTRLVLREYARAWSTGGQSLNLRLPSDLPLNPIANDVFVQPASWPAGLGYQASLAALLDKYPVQQVGMLWGWKAGDDLDSLSDSESHYRVDVWKLLNNRFTIRDYGSMVSYTLNYLVGFLHNERIRAIVASAPGGAPPAATDKASILQKLGSELADDLKPKAGPAAAASDLEALTKWYFEIVLGEFYAITQNTSMKIDVKTKALAAYRMYLSGYNDGALRAADAVYHDVFKLAYGLGYADGFRDGYSKGYADGYKDGYAIAYAKAWEEANKVITDLRAQIGNLQGQLNKGSGTSFWDNLGRAVSIGGTVIGTIASLF